MRWIHSAFWEGVRAELPILLSDVPFGLIFASAALAAGIAPVQVQAMSWMIYAGSAQLVLTQLIGDGAHPAVIILTLTVVNLRHLLYSASVAPYLQTLRRGYQLGLAYFLTDEAYVVSILKFTREPSVIARGWFLAGAGVALWVMWQFSTWLGLVLGRQLPPSIPLDFALPLTFIALVIPTIRDRASVVAAVVAGVVIIVAINAPLKLGLIIAALAGMAAGVLVDRMQPVAAEAE